MSTLNNKINSKTTQTGPTGTEIAQSQPGAEVSQSQPGAEVSQSQTASSAFIDGMEKKKRDSTTKAPGWNGTSAYNREKLIDSYDGVQEIEAALTDIFSNCTRGNEKMVLRSLKKALDVFSSIPEESTDVRGEYLGYILSILAVVRNSREAMGERLIFYTCLIEIFKFNVRYGQFLLTECIRTFGSYADLKGLWEICSRLGGEHFSHINECIARLFAEAVIDNDLKFKSWCALSDEDRKTLKPPTYNLAPKWIPKAGPTYKRGASIDVNDLNLIVAYRVIPNVSHPSSSLKMNEVAKMFRKLISEQNKRVNTVEISMCGGDFEHLPYAIAPAGARKKYGKLSWKNINPNGSQRSAKEDRVKGAEENAKCVKSALETGWGIKASNAGIVSIVEELNKSYPFTSTGTKEDLQARWNVCVSEMKTKIPHVPEVNSLPLGNMVVVCDVSRSMQSGQCSVRPLDVAIAMGLFVGNFTTAPWDSGVITFHKTPTWHSLPKGDSTKDELWNKFMCLNKAPWGSNTDFAKVLDLVMDVIESGDLKQKDCPQSILVVSDMQVDQADRSGNTMVEHAQKRFTDKGFKAPVIILWNVNASGTTPVTPYQEGVMCISGYSENMLRMILDGSILSHQPPTPWETTKIAITKEWTSNIHSGSRSMTKHPNPSKVVPTPFEEFWMEDDQRWVKDINQQRDLGQSSPGTPEKWSYSKFLDKKKKGEVDIFGLNQDCNSGVGVDNDGSRFTVDIPNDLPNEMLAFLLKHNVKMNADPFSLPVESVSSDRSGEYRVVNGVSRGEVIDVLESKGYDPEISREVMTVIRNLGLGKVPTP